MSLETEHFLFDNPVFEQAQSMETNTSRSPGQRIMTGLQSLDAACKSCTNVWRASNSLEGGLRSAYGTFLIDCPYCRATEAVQASALTRLIAGGLVFWPD